MSHIFETDYALSHMFIAGHCLGTLLVRSGIIDSTSAKDCLRMAAKKFRSLTAITGSLLAAGLLLTGCTGNDAPSNPAPVTNDGVESAAQSLDGVYVSDKSAVFVAIQGEGITRYSMGRSQNYALTPSPQMLKEVAIFGQNSSEGVSDDDLISTGTFRTIDGKMVIDWDENRYNNTPDEELMFRNIDTLQVGTGVHEYRYFPVSSDLGQERMTEINESYQDK